MLSKKISEAINEQIKHEFYSAYYYLAIVAWCDSHNLTGAAHFFRLQSQEEWGHGMKFFEYMLDRNGKIQFEELQKPQMEFKSLSGCVSHAFEHEKFVTKRIYDLMDLAHKEKDYATVNLLNWFVEEQVEEEATMEQILDRMKIAGDEGTGILLIDNELSQRSAAE